MKRLISAKCKTVGELRDVLSGYDDGLDLTSVKVYITQEPEEPYKMIIESINKRKNIIKKDKEKFRLIAGEKS